jgi:putative ABC transport system permease protein
MIGSALTEIRLAIRALGRSPGFAIAAVLTLALGIGATTAVFSVVYGVVYRPLPFPTADRLVRVIQILPRRSADVEPARAGLSPDQVAEWRATSRTLTAIGYYGPSTVALTGVPTAVRVNGAIVSVALFRALGVAPIRGRLFVDEEEQRGNEQVVILGYRLWNARFGAADDVLGRSLVLNGRPYRVVGVMPEGFGFPSVAFPSMSLNSAGELSDAPELWMPIVARARPAGPATGGLSLVQTLALVRPGITLTEAKAESNRLMPARTGERWPVDLVSPRDEEAREVRPVLMVFQTAVLFVLFIACANVINLLLARMADRRRELAVRLALGATRFQLARHAMAESLVIGIVGGALGCLLAYLAVGLFRTLPPYLLPRMAEVHVDLVALSLAATVSILSGLLVGLIAVLRTLRGDLSDRWIPWPSRTASVSRVQRPSRLLVVAETAAGIVLLAGAGLLLTSFVRLTSVDRGFQADGLYTFRVSLPQARYREAAAQYAFHDDLASQVRRLPGVEAIGAATAMPGQWAIGFTLEIDGQPVKGSVWYNHVTPGVFQTLRIPLRGRDFTERDRTAGANVAIVNQTFARRFFGERDPVGRRIRFQDWMGLDIIGVAGDTRTGELDDAINPEIYLPTEFDTPVFAAPTYVVRAENASGLVAAIRTAAARLEPDAVVFDGMAMDAFLARTVTNPRVYGWTAAGFAAVAVILAALGLYSVLAYSIGTRTREFGIRMALGAATRAVVSTVMKEALAMVALGIGIGTAAAWYLSRFLETLLFGIERHDPSTFTLVALLFAAVATLACYFPARRATRVDPVVALRAE